MKMLSSAFLRPSREQLRNRLNRLFGRIQKLLMFKKTHRFILNKQSLKIYPRESMKKSSTSLSKRRTRDSRSLRVTSSKKINLRLTSQKKSLGSPVRKNMRLCSGKASRRSHRSQN